MSPIVRRAIGEALGAPGLIMGASFLGFGSIIHDGGHDIIVGLASTIGIWALPGQIAMIEMFDVGASLAVVTLAVLLANVRLLPLVVTLLPRLGVDHWPRWRRYLLAHWIAVTSWVVTMRRLPELNDDEKLPYFLSFAGTLWSLSVLCTGAGYLLAGVVPAPVSLVLIFLNPIYFMLLLAGERAVHRLAAIIGGAVLGPLIHLVSPDWSLLAAGLGAGTAVFLFERVQRA